MFNKSVIISILALLVLALGGCIVVRSTQAPTQSPLDMANPASVYCEQQGGKIEMQRDPQGGEFGVCVFPDGSRCEEWAYLRGECTPGGQPEPVRPTTSSLRPADASLTDLANPAGVYCQWMGGRLELRSDPSQGDGQARVCLFDDGSQCEAWAFFRNECQPASPQKRKQVLGMPNPASVGCEQYGGHIELRDDGKGGQLGMCVFADGSQCEEWALFRGQCQPPGGPVPGIVNPATIFCEQNNGKLQAGADRQGNPVAVCTFADGSQCEEWAYLRGECQPGSQPDPTSTPTSPVIGLANPASVFCAQNGGRLEIRDGENGQFGMCLFPDGSQCEEWAYLRGECQPGSRSTAPAPPALNMANPASLFCEQQGGKLEIRQDAQGGEYGVCIFPDGGQCEEWAFFNGKCQPGPTPQATPEYTNALYGYTIKIPEGWRVEEKDSQQIILRSEFYELFLGVQRPGEGPETFRSGLPAGEFVDGGTFTLLGQPQPKKLLVLDGRTKLVDYGSRLEAGPLLLSAWLEYRGAADYAAVDLPAALIAQADSTLASFAVK